LKVGYKAVVFENGDIDKEASLDFMVARGAVTPCCDQMSQGMKYRNIVFEDDGVCCHFNLDWSDGEGEYKVINFCPFCGEPITLEEIKRVKKVNHPITKTIDHYVEEEI